MRLRTGDPSIMVPAVVNGIPGNFIIDTGATSVALTKGFAARIGLDLRRARVVQIRTATQVEDAYAARVARIELGGAGAENVDVTVLNSQIGDADGLLGLAFLGRFRMTLDPERELLELQAP